MQIAAFPGFRVPDEDLFGPRQIGGPQQPAVSREREKALHPHAAADAIPKLARPFPGSGVEGVQCILWFPCFFCTHDNGKITVMGEEGSEEQSIASVQQTAFAHGSCRIDIYSIKLEALPGRGRKSQEISRQTDGKSGRGIGRQIRADILARTGRQSGSDREAGHVADLPTVAIIQVIDPLTVRREREVYQPRLAVRELAKLAAVHIPGIELISPGPICCHHA